MEAASILERLGGVADARVLIAHTSRRRVRNALVRGEIVRDARGRYALPTAVEALRSANRLGGVVSHRSAAAWWGWELKWQPDRPEVMVPRNRKVVAARREGVALHWGEVCGGEVIGGRVTSPGRTVLGCAKALSFDEALAIADSALRHRNLTPAFLMQAADEVQGPGRAACRRVALHASGKAANPFESVMRAIALDVRGLQLVPQVTVTVGGMSFRPNLVDERRRLIVEAESFEFHGRRSLLARDCERYDLLVLDGWTVLRFSWEHVMFHPEFVEACLRAHIDRFDLPGVARLLAAIRT